ncbi:hypothetical protein NEOLEDRAFT_1151896 [Neolentinus lepideus HHB14362 ss-1]|uniref:F-box domain-containing protein n=1 Tax=Neolentinus lepideus HHB14362 ss-1 TaxID=1314782 RepID=A0A165NDH9_9AGAM|nr:hypothetical protein NEOLEDRAFT_1151896 [Neolentinus lepideus HHB14362 ss-1]
MFLEDLPSELIEYIFVSLDWPGLIICQKVCKLFCTIVKSSAHLQYNIELAVAGYVHGAADGYVSAAEHLESLRRHQDAWKNPAIDRAEIIELENNQDQPSSLPFHRYEIRDNVLLVMRRKGQLQEPHAFNALDVMLLEAVDRSFPSWTLDLNSPYTGLAFDPAQDLLILRDEGEDTLESSNTHIVYTRYQALSLRNGTLHPRAQCKDIRITQPVYLAMILLGDFVASPIILDLRSLDSVVLVNWITGSTRLVRPASGLGRRVRTAHLCFLSGSQLLTIDDRKPALDLYGCNSGSWESAEHLATLDLPSYHNHAISAALLTSSINRDLASVYPSQSRSSATFYPIPSRAALVCLQLRFLPHAYNQDQESKNYTVIICVSAMLDMIGRVRDATDSRIPAIIQWSTWGPSCTRWFGHLAPLQRIRMHGFRIAFPNRILDFNPIDIARDLLLDGLMPSEQSERGEENLEVADCFRVRENIVTESAIIPGGNLFHENISTALRYRETVLDSTLPFVDLYSNQGMIGLERNTVSAIKALHFLTVQHSVLDLEE